MEKLTNREQLSSVEPVKETEDTGDVSGVFRVLEGFSNLSQTHKSSQEAVGGIITSSNLEPDEYAPVLKGALVKLNELDKQEGQIIAEAHASVLKTIRDWVNKHRMAATLLVAGALHSPVIFKSTGFAESIQNILQNVKKWEMPNMVIRPQIEAEKQDVINRIHERGARVDHQKINAYKKEQLKKIENGEAIKLNDTYLELEELNGENPEKVKIAKQKKQEMINKFAERMGSDLSEEFIESVVNEMFGADTNYEWGQGSTTEYFITGKRNCVSIARAEQMVFEALIDRLPEANRDKYQLGTAFEKQHEIAILKVLKPDKTISRTYFLQPPVNTLFGTAERPGSPTVDLASMQRAMMSEKPTKISSNAKAGDIPPSPDIEVLTNQPVSSNIEIQGELKGSGYIERIVKDRKIEIQWKEPSITDDIPDLEIIKNDQVHKAKTEIQKSYEFIEAHTPHCEDIAKCLDKESLDKAIPFCAIDLSSIDWKNLPKNQVKEIIDNLKYDRKMVKPDTVNFGNIDNLPQDKIDDFILVGYPEIQFTIKKGSEEARLINSILKYNQSFQESKKQKLSTFPRLHLNLDEDLPDHYFVQILNNFKGEELILDRKNTKTRAYYTDQEVEAIITSKVDNLYLEGADFTEEAIQKIINNPNKTYHFGLTLYLENLERYPEIINLTHIRPWIDKVLTSSELQDVIDNLHLEKRASIVPFLEKIERESIDKFFNAHR